MYIDCSIHDLMMQAYDTNEPSHPRICIEIANATSFIYRLLSF